MKQAILLLLMGVALYAQPRLSFSSAATVPLGSAATVNVNLIGGGMNPAALQVSFAAPVGATITAGSAVPASGLFGSFISNGVATIAVAGVTAVLPDGVIAVVSFPAASFQFTPLNPIAVNALANLVTFTASPYYFLNPCDLTGDGLLTVADIQAALDQTTGKVACTTADLTGDAKCTVVDIQRVVNAVAGAACRIGQ